jgi:Leucine-rich repeat (LRR) protein
MDQLTRLSMDRNHLTRIPADLYKLGNLSVLELSGNGLESLPEGLENLGKLKKLDLSKNQLTRVPEGLSAMGGHLKDLYIQGNKIPPEEVERLASALPNTSIRY